MSNLRESSPVLPTEIEPCPACDTHDEHIQYLYKLHPLSHDAAPVVGPDDIDWNDYYWGYNWNHGNRNERKIIVRPLPLTITTRISPKLYERILQFFLWERRDLYNCALVCRAWYRQSQLLLCSHVVIKDSAAYNSVVQYALQEARSGEYLANTSWLTLSSSASDDEQKSYWSEVPLVLGKAMHTVKCLQCFGVLRPSYHSSFTALHSAFSSLIHLELRDFQLNSFSELRIMICSLQNLRELYLLGGGLVSSTTKTDSLSEPPLINAPRIREAILAQLDHILLCELAHWMISTEVCQNCTGLHLNVRNPEEGRQAGLLLRALGSSLNTVSYSTGYSGWSDAGFLTCCTRLSSLSFNIKVDPMCSWPGFVTTFSDIISNLSSPVLESLIFNIHVEAPEDSPFSATHPDGDFAAIDLRSIHDSMTHKVFDSLRDVRISVFHGDDGAPRLTCDTMLTAKEVERRIRLILDPWSKRGILGVQCHYDESTDEELTRMREDATQKRRNEGDSEQRRYVMPQNY